MNDQQQENNYLSSYNSHQDSLVTQIGDENLDEKENQQDIQKIVKAAENQSKKKFFKNHRNVSPQDLEKIEQIHAIKTNSQIQSTMNLNTVSKAVVATEAAAITLEQDCEICSQNSFCGLCRLCFC